MNVAQSPRGCAGPSRHGYLRATLTGSTLGPPSQAPNLSNLRATTVTCSLRHSLERPFWPQATDIPIIPPQAASQSLLPKSAGLQANMDLSKRDSMELPEADRAFLETHLPSSRSTSRPDLPFTTLTFATSLDSALALAPGTRTVLSGPQSKAMTHYLRSRHDGILIGVGTALADDPGLNCRIAGVGGYGGQGLEGQPRPVVIDPSARWDFSENSKLFQLCAQGQGRAPWIVTALQQLPADKAGLLEKYGGKYISLKMETNDSGRHHIDWHDLLVTLRRNGLRSIMVEGGAQVINSLLEPQSMSLVDSVIVTIAPTWLGQGGVVVSPARRRDSTGTPVAAARLTNIQWHPVGEDVVLCGQIKRDS